MEVKLSATGGDKIDLGMEIVSFELAKKLKEKGFPQHITDEAYIVENYGEEECDIGDRLPIPLVPDYMDDVAAPTISQVLKWLREEKKIHITIDYYPAGYNADIYTGLSKKDGFFDNEEYINECDCYDTYELAALAGIEYVIDNLI